MREIDANGDGKISLGEWESIPEPSAEDDTQDE